MATANYIKALVDNPESFLKVNRLRYSIRRQLSGQKLVELVPGPVISYNIKLSGTESENTISAYVLGYSKNQKNDASFLDIPSRDVEEGKFFFTAELTGCSLVVTRLNDDTYRVFHDYRTNSAVLYDNVVMCLDYDDHKIRGLYSAAPAVACMQFRDGAWKLFVQHQYPASHYIITKGLEMVKGLHLDVKDSVNTFTSLQTSFDFRRWAMQHRIKDLAKALSIDSALIGKAEDGTYAGSGEFDDNDPSIREWKELRNAIETELTKNSEELRNDIQKKQANAAAQLKKIDTDFWNYKEMVVAAQKLDNIWLWLQINKATGANGNGSTRELEVQPNDTISERYAEIERDLSSGSDNAEFNMAYEKYGSTEIPQIESTVTSSEMKELFVTTDELSVEQKGALCRRISIASNQEPLLEQQVQIQNDFESHSKGFIESAPQNFFLSNVGDKCGRLCYSLVRAMAVVLSTGEKVAKSFLDKLGEFLQDELTPSQQKNAECLRDALAGLHANAEAHSASPPQPDVFGII